jgi:hypothetical protein|tara:strand:- start:88 stop:594 length:507 start_codon:yes stop_codon:yes gene_type:complete
MLERKKENNPEDRMIFVPGNIPSLKNSKVKTSRGIFHSPTVSKFIRSLGIQHFNSRKKEIKGYKDPLRPNRFEALRSKFEKMKEGKDDPIIIGYHQVRNSKRLFDFSNSVELVQDLLTAHDFIEDDNVQFVFPVPMTIDGELPVEGKIRDKPLYSVDKANPGVWIKLF